MAAGIVLPPVQQYALIENALGAAERLPPERQRDEIAALWARFNAVAARNPEAAFPSPATRSTSPRRARTTGRSLSRTTGGTPASGPSTSRRRS